jgi:hypothetical protein
MSLTEDLNRISICAQPYISCRWGEFGERVAQVAVGNKDERLAAVIGNVCQQCYEQGIARGKKQAAETLGELIVKGPCR